MARSGTPQPDQSLGDLVAQAAKDISQLIRYEIDLAKSELRVDVRRVAFAAGLGAFCGLAGCLIVIMLCFAYAYGLAAAGLPGGVWAGFLVAAFTILVLAVIAGLIAWRRVRGMTRLRRTRKTVADDIGMLRRGDGSGPESVTAATGPAELPGQSAG